mmetsp:Transcript_172742/g.548510  ORF Transcript_172742/g.548510 Transcript_172742/m.548510 type:complete len:85 (+) Transcript_172742:18-272(+)
MDERLLCFDLDAAGVRQYAFAHLSEGANHGPNYLRDQWQATPEEIETFVTASGAGPSANSDGELVGDPRQLRHCEKRKMLDKSD